MLDDRERNACIVKEGQHSESQENIENFTNELNEKDIEIEQLKNLLNTNAAQSKKIINFSLDLNRKSFQF